MIPSLTPRAGGGRCNAPRKRWIIRKAVAPTASTCWVRSNPSVWHLAQVLEFLQARQYAFPQAVLEVARTAMQINIAKEQPLLDQRLATSIRQRLHA